MQVGSLELQGRFRLNERGKVQKNQSKDIVAVGAQSIVSVAGFCNSGSIGRVFNRRSRTIVDLEPVFSCKSLSDLITC